MTANSPQRGGASPSSSPRLPSPPPFTEVQFGPQSPGVGASVSEFQLDNDKQDEGALRRIRPGSQAIDMEKGPPFVPLHQLESPFQLQEYLKSLYYKLTKGDKPNTMVPVTKETAIELATPPIAADAGETVDRNLWLYELCRFLCSKTTRLIVAFFADNPPCSSQTCPEMRASEWQYLCAVHEPPKSCCAIDYCNHTLDWASNILTSTKHFPSRLSLGADGGNAYQSMRQLTNIFRRVYRIYAHAWFQHREVFWMLESELGLYMFFKTVCDVYQLIPEDNYTIPPEAEGIPGSENETPVSTSSPQRKQILQNNATKQEDNEAEAQSSMTVSTGATTRRHKHTPSTGVPVAVIAEGQEEDEEPPPPYAVQRSSEPITNTSISPEREVTKTRSPGSIVLPVDDDPERPPEDPTPVAVHDNNPFNNTIHQSTPSSVAEDLASSSSSSSSLSNIRAQSHSTDATESDDDAETTILLAEPEEEHAGQDSDRSKISAVTEGEKVPSVSYHHHSTTSILSKADVEPKSGDTTAGEQDTADNKTLQQVALTDDFAEEGNQSNDGG